MEKGLYSILFSKRDRIYVEINQDCVQGFKVNPNVEYDGFVELLKIQDKYYIQETEF